MLEIEYTDEPISVDDIQRLKEEYERMRNCINCDHKPVCSELKLRETMRENLYTPCDYWKVVSL